MLTREPVRAIAFLLAASAMLAGCATRPLPKPRVENALYRDLERLVTVSDSSGWQIDRLELDSMLEAALLSICRVDTSTTGALLEWLDLRIAELGGPVKDAYVERGKKLDEIDDLLEVERIRMLLRHAENWRDNDCPFWIEVEPDFHGEQIFDDRFLLFLATGGKGIFVEQYGRADISFGGAGRLLIGRSFGSRITAYIGGEIGAVASFPRDANGGRSNLVLGLDGVAPFVLRYRFVNTYVEAEAGWYGHITEDDRKLESGFHLGAAVGGQTNKQLWFFPGVSIAASYERAGTLQAVKVGLRVSAELPL
jgi:hypothetical protein